jgi:tetratricopeptide (TPR) repeat protein
MNRVRVLYRFLLPAFFIVVLCSAAVSCRMSASRHSFTGKLDEVDVLIEQGQDKDAVDELKKIEKKTYDSWFRIGIFRRYNLLGETELAERVLKQGLRKNPENPELSAVYSNYLLRKGRIAEAVQTADCLQGTEYGSIYSEAYLDSVISPAEKGALSYADKKFYPVYYDAYEGSHDSYWLRSCAVVCMRNGEYDKAAALLPDDCTEPDDAYFWSLVAFDNKLYGNAAALAERAQSLYPAASIKSRGSVSPVEIASILSDAYVSLSESEEGERVRRSLLDSLSADKTYAASGSEPVNAMLPAVYVDSALYAGANGNDAECSRLLSYTVDTWPDFVPGLISYADFAYRTSLPPAETPQETVLRDKGLATLRMEKYDNRAKIPVSDAVYRIEKSLKRKNDPLLYIARLDLKYKTDKTLTVNEKIADVWKDLEDSETGTDTYPELLLEFAVSKLLSYGQVEDAWTLYRKYIKAKYTFDAARDFWEQTAAQVKAFTLTEAEYAAWFAAYQRYADTAVRLYEYCVYESGGVSSDSEAQKRVSAYVSISSCMNLAMIYNSLGAIEQSLDLYAAAASRTVDVKQKAEIMYRMALIYSASQKKSDALRAADYALSLDSAHARAKLLRDRLTAVK